MKPIKTALFCFALTASCLTYSDDQIAATTIQLPVGSQGNTSLELPERGWTQRQVELVHGAPERFTNVVGEPPISTWHYAEFSVYFESDLVIHSVLRHRTASN